MRPAHNRTVEQWQKLAGRLNKFGYSFPTKLRKKDVPGVRRARLKNQRFLSSVENKNKKVAKVYFRPFNKDQRGRLIKPKPGLISKHARTPGGFFYQLPKGATRATYKLRVTKTGDVRTSYATKNEVIVRLRASGLARDPRAEAMRAVGRRRPVSIVFIVNGFMGKQVMSPGYFFDYVVDLLGAELSSSAIAETFQLRLIYPSTPRKKSRARPKHKARRKA
jgi:hypothetical protein